MIRLASLALPSLLAACAAAGDPAETLAGRAFAPDAAGAGALRALEAATARPAPVAAAVLRLPEAAGPVVAVSVERRAGGTRQRITWAGDARIAGENAATVEVGDGADRPGRPTEEAITREAAAALPAGAAGGPMRFGHNALGDWGAILDRAGPAATCVYAWQNLETERPGGLSAAAPRRVAIRLRHCRSGAGEAALLALVAGLTPEAPLLATAAIMPGRDPDPLASAAALAGGRADTVAGWR